MRAYLLGTLPNNDAVALEERYLADRACFLWVKEIESGLIREYLDGKFTPAETALFEDRYLRVADLRARLEEIRAQRRQIANKPAFSWRFALVTSIGLVGVCALGVALFLQPASQSSARPPVVAEPESAPIRVTLRAGVAQSGSSSMQTFSLPAKAAQLEFVLELPGTMNERCRAVLSEIDGNGRLQTVLNSKTDLIPDRVENVDLITFRVDSKRLHRGDYVISVRKSSGGAIGSFVFRAL